MRLIINNKFKQSMIKYLFGLSFLFLVACQSDKSSEEQMSELPNIVFILADDLGYGDLSFLGQKKFDTPNIDRLAEEGLFFSQMYSGSTVCAPSRSAFVSGQHTGHTFIRGNKEVQPEGQYPIPDSIYTIFQFFRDRGYATGAFGKWGLGYPGSEGDPMNQGVEEFYGFNCQRLGHNYYPYYLWDNAEKIELTGNQGQGEEEYAPYLIQEKALEFIRKNKEGPFFLFRPTIIPHAELKAPSNVLADFIARFPEDTPYKGIDEGPNYKLGGYGSQAHPHAAFAAMIHILDHQVGQIVKLLDDLGIRENTLIVFSSDNGPHLEGGADPDFFDSNGPFRGYKRDLYEGGIRVPTIFNWPGTIDPGTTDQLSAFWDLYPTFADVTETRMNEMSGDGVSLYPTLIGKSDQQNQHDYLYWEFHEAGGRLAVRQADFKLIYYNIKKPDERQIELYNIAEDPGETNDLSEQFPEKVEALKEIAEQARVPSEIFPFQVALFD